MNTLQALSLFAALALASACSTPGVQPAQPQALASESQTAADATDAEEAAVKARAQAALPKQPLTPEILFKFLVAEVAGQRGAIHVAQPAYMDLARQTRDPRIARRAAEISMFARNQSAALEATQLWAATEQDSERAQQTLAALLLNEGKFNEAEPVLRGLLKADPANGFMQLAAMTGKTRDPQAALALIERLAADYPQVPEARFAVAQAAIHGGRPELATTALQQASALRPGWEPAVLMRAQMLSKAAPAEALALLRDFVAAYPDAREARLAYARMLVNTNQIPQARAEFDRLARDFPQNAEVSLAAGLLALQMGDAGAARDLLTQTLAHNPRDANIVHYYLGQLAEQAKQAEQAAAHYAEVKSGQYLVAARSRQATLLAQAGKLDEARALLAFTQGDDPAQNVRLIQAQAELLTNYKMHAEAFAVLSEGMKRFPDAADLLYDRAMAAERLNKLDVMEADLRRVIALRPDHAQAYNALGYTLADRKVRLPEALVLLDKALALAPDDPFILDSVGWAQYRAGNLARAQEYLERAFQARPDPEIAAHLGEVLWARGQRDAAGKLWQTSLQTHPQNAVLLETLQRHNP